MSDDMITQLPSARSNVAWTKLPDGAVLFAPETEVYYAMNGVAALVWELLPQHADSIDALCAAIGERFPDATPEQIRDDVVELLDDLNRSGLVESTAIASAR
jgi:Coenzyme PQQ synthesis protein D (PqqD)